MKVGLRVVASAVLLVVAVAAAGVSGCSEARLEKVPPPDPPVLDNRLRIKGDFCTEPSARVEFPVKVLYLIDQSTSLQCTDSMNRRFSALNNSIAQVLEQPNAEFAFLGFSSWSRTTDFTRNRDSIAGFVDPGQGLGPATDYQGALATAIRLLEEDMLNSGPALRARTRYIINFVSDGVPAPRCNPGCEDDEQNCSDGDDNDGDGMVDGGDPDCANVGNASLAPDTLYAVCNYTDDRNRDENGNLVVDGEQVYVDMTGLCPEYNQNYQIMQRVEELIGLKDIYSVGDVTLNSVLLFSPQPIVDAVCPGAVTDFGIEKIPAKALLQQMADAGNGTFRDVNLTADDDNFLGFEISSILAEQTMSQIFVVNQHSRVEDAGLLVDRDTDGLSDDFEFLIGTDRNSPDSDGDNYGDLYEHRLAKEGFDPTDARLPAIACGDDRDGDGDGLRDCEESFLKTDPLLPDTDGDGILDYYELVVNTDPLVADGLDDLDFDGILNLDEIRGYTNPRVPDAANFRDARISYDIDDEGLTDDNERRRCYQYDIKNIQMQVTPLAAQQGLNRILVYTSERPAQIAGVPGEVRVGCFDAFYNGTTLKLPLSGEIDLTQEGLDRIRDDLQQSFLQVSRCGYWGQAEDGTPNIPTRNQFRDMTNACMPVKVEVSGRLLLLEDMQELTQRIINNDSSPRIPSIPYEIFVPITEFNPENDCVKPWEFEILKGFFRSATDACYACVAEREAAQAASEMP